MDRFVVFDTETPNAFNDRMSAIGVAVVEDGEVVETFSSLVNPQEPFHMFNIQLTGILPEQAALAPTFPELWEAKLASVMENGVLVAHNAPFDMSVLSKCLRAYGIRWKPVVAYACTCQIGRSPWGRHCLPPVPNHRLDTLCAGLHIPLDHHRAGSDSEACAALLVHYLKNGVPVEKYIRRYDLVAGRTVQPEKRRRTGRI